MDTENYKPYSEMTEWERESAIHSARYILEDVNMEKLADVTGLPLGVIVSAFENIFVENVYGSHMVFTICNGYVKFQSKMVTGSQPFVDNSWEKTVEDIKNCFNPRTIEIIKN